MLLGRSKKCFIPGTGESFAVNNAADFAQNSLKIVRSFSYRSAILERCAANCVADNAFICAAPNAASCQICLAKATTWQINNGLELSQRARCEDTKPVQCTTAIGWGNAIMAIANNIPANRAFYNEVFLVTCLPAAAADANCRLRRQFIHRYVRLRTDAWRHLAHNFS